MSKKTTLLTVIIAAALLLVVIAIAMNAPDKTKKDSTTETSQTPSSTSTPTTTEGQPVAATIAYTDNGFQPAKVTVKSGDTIRIENKSANALSFNSGDHPTHTKDSELNVGDVSQGESRTFMVSRKGTWSFHNHYNASDTGEIVVE